MSYRTTVRTFGPSPASDSFLLKGLEDAPETISTEAADHSSSRAELRNVKPIASYSWIGGPTPSIAVPASPRIWKTTTVTTVPADSGVHYVDRNTSFMGRRSALIPIFAAVDSLHDDFRYRDFDLVTDRNNLRKLLRCIDGQHEKTFRIDLDVLGKTCLFTRREETLAETLTEFRGYGHEYEMAATKPRRGSEDEISHHRIISYDFGGLKVLLRYEVDACAEPESEDDSFLASFSTLSIGATGGAPTLSNDSAFSSRFGMKVKLTSPRSVLPQSSVIEIKTRAARRELDWKEVYPQLYLSQTSYLYLAKHTRGTFGRVEKFQINSEGMAAHAREAEASMAKLEALLSAILKAVRKYGEGVPLSLVYRAGELQLYKRKQGTRRLFGKDILSKFPRVAAN
ncbi:hypothetical protein F5J12DRAFT_101327 [Pisolithus orientalis]|uniref:uncharacterized protein n=1 Tax=Pisolithus orientalis TaxID=936130 RepID=UPI0022250C59|nr:uncharacterized protein F5J12DRAFT_101327 [Pisolithus orientalis]KAI6006616.1 hypothetical protein F5J12DRAFT_101327 [Pisolithus orientalis]